LAGLGALFWGAKLIRSPRGDRTIWLPTDVYFENCITKPTRWDIRLLDEKLPPSKCDKKALVSRQTLGHFSTLDLTQTFEEVFHQFAHSTATCRDS